MIFLGRQTFKNIHPLAMRTKVKNILEGLKTFCQTALENRGKYVSRQADFTRERKMTFNNLCFFLSSSRNAP